MIPSGDKMTLEDRAVLSAKDEKLKNELISEYKNFILSSASKVLKKSVTVNDDEFMIAMIAFNEAINSYNSDKGKFLSFAAIIIHNRIVDYLRNDSRNRATPFSAIETEDDDGQIVEVDMPSYDSGDLKWEIEALTEELEAYNISLFELTEVSPKSRKTKRICFDAINYIRSDKQLIDSVIKKQILPIKEITDNTKSNRKTLERHRKYIITAMIVLTQDYPSIAEYFRFKEV